MNMMTTIRSDEQAVLPAADRVRLTERAAHSGEVDRGSWERALSRYRTARATLEAFSAGEMHRAAENWTRVRDQWPTDHDFGRDPVAQAQLDGASLLYDPIEAEFDRLVGVCSDEMGAMMLIPAPDAAALAYKIDLFFEDDCYDRTWDIGPAIEETLRADAARFASMTPAAQDRVAMASRSALDLGSRAITQSFYRAFALDRAHDEGSLNDPETQFAWAAMRGADLRIVECGIHDDEHVAVTALALAFRLESMIDGNRLRGKDGKSDYIELDGDVLGEVALMVRGLNNIVRYHERAGRYGQDFHTYAAYVRDRCRLRA